MYNDKRIQYYKDQIKKLETYTPSYTIDYLKVIILILFGLYYGNSTILHQTIDSVSILTPV